MITVVTPFSRRQNIELMANVLKGKANWTVLIDDESLRPLFPDWVTVKLYELPPPVDPKYKYDFMPSNRLFNMFLDEGIDDEIQYMILCDDDSVEPRFFEKIPTDDVVICSMKRGDNPIQGNYCAYPTTTLLAHPDNMQVACVAGEQLIIKGKILKNYRYGESAVGDGEMVVKVVAENHVTYVPNAYVLFNYFENGRYNNFRRKPLVLFIGDYYCAANPNLGLSEWEGNIWASLDSTDLVDIARFHFDKYFYHTGKRGDEAVLERIYQINPDLVVMILYKPLGSDPTVISQEVVDIIANHKKIPIVTIWGDLEIEEQRDLAKIMAPYCSKVVGTASKEIVEGLGYKYMHVPKDSKFFNNPGLFRDIDVVFSGSFGYGRDDRREVLQHLIDNDIKLLAGGSEGGEHLTVQEYTSRYKRAKLALSFSRVAGRNVVNARPFEVMSCGALLLEQDSPELAKLYTPYYDYVPWDDKEDLLKKVKYYLSHPVAREGIAANGQKKTEERYSAKTFWEEVLK